MCCDYTEDSQQDRQRETKVKQRLTGKHRHVVLVRLAQGVVDNAVLIRKAFEDVHTNLETQFVDCRTDCHRVFLGIMILTCG